MKSFYIYKIKERIKQWNLLFLYDLNEYDFVLRTFYDVNFALSHQLLAGEREDGES